MTACLANYVVCITTVAASLGRRVVGRQTTHRIHVLARRRIVTIATLLAVMNYMIFRDGLTSLMLGSKSLYSFMARETNLCLSQLLLTLDE